MHALPPQSVYIQLAHRIIFGEIHRICLGNDLMLPQSISWLCLKYAKWISDTLVTGLVLNYCINTGFMKFYM